MAALLWIPLLVPACSHVTSAFRRRDSVDPRGRPRRGGRRARRGLALLAHRAGLGSADRGAARAARRRLTAWLVTTIGAVAVTALWGGLPKRGRPGRAGRPLHGARVPVPGRDEPGRARRQPRHPVGRRRGHHDHHRLPGRPPPRPALARGRLEVRRPRLGRGRDRLPRHRPALRRSRRRRDTRPCPGTCWPAGRSPWTPT